LYLYRIPVRAGGRWLVQLPAEFSPLPITLEITQQWRRVAGLARQGGRVVPLQQVTLHGEYLSFRMPIGLQRSVVFAGRIDGDSIRGLVRAGEVSGKWSAMRADAAGETARATR
ncbi:MAG TPA: hypothetical protein VM491_01160, partial [Burkholderiaceae bacterium]|nr:hypothetical protein [Burkholderiaceae bacterium]